jgi:hypothetical protein
LVGSLQTLIYRKKGRQQPLVVKYGLSKKQHISCSESQNFSSAMTSRKPTFMAGLSPVPSAGAARGNIAMMLKQKQQQQATAGLSKEYLQAVQTLNEASMNQACELLLSSIHCDRNRSNEEDKTAQLEDAPKSVSEQLKEMYLRAEEAQQVIRTQQPKVMPGAPSLSGPSGGRILPRTGTLGAAIKSKPTSLAQLAKPVAGHSLKSGVFPVRRTGKPSLHHHHMHHHHNHHPAQGGQHKRTISEPRGAAAAAAAAVVTNKKQRVSPLPPAAAPQPTMTTELQATAPPPSALSFLAKLNKKQKGDAAAASTLKEPLPQDEEEEEEEEQDDEVGKGKHEEEAEDDDSLRRRRKNPSRGFHPNRR